MRGDYKVKAESTRKTGNQGISGPVRIIEQTFYVQSREQAQQLLVPETR